jgi:hypothetical protein
MMVSLEDGDSFSDVLEAKLCTGAKLYLGVLLIQSLFFYFFAGDSASSLSKAC